MKIKKAKSFGPKSPKEWPKPYTHKGMTDYMNTPQGKAGWKKLEDKMKNIKISKEGTLIKPPGSKQWIDTGSSTAQAMSKVSKPIKKSKEILEKELSIFMKCENLINKLQDEPISKDVLMKAYDGNPPEELIKECSKRPKQGWWDSCIKKAEKFTDTPEKFCGNLHYTPSEHSGGDKTKESFGKEDDDNLELEIFGKGVVKELPEGVAEIEAEDDEHSEEISDTDIEDFGGQSDQNKKVPYNPKTSDLKPSEKNISN